jgi:hypothetical protein
LWSARCSETGTAGAGGGSGKPTGGNTGRAPRVDLTGRTLQRRRDDVLAYFTHRASNGPTEAINGRLEALRRNALGFRNLINYRLPSLLHCGALGL